MRCASDSGLQRELSPLDHYRDLFGVCHCVTWATSLSSGRLCREDPCDLKGAERLWVILMYTESWAKEQSGRSEPLCREGGGHLNISLPNRKQEFSIGVGRLWGAGIQSWGPSSVGEGLEKTNPSKLYLELGHLQKQADN